MSSFKRRLRTAPPDMSGASSMRLPKPPPATGRTASLYPPGVKSGTWGTSAPVVSLGLAAIDDLVSGGGQPVGSTLLLLPTTDTYPLPLPTGDGFGLTPAMGALASAEPYLDLVLAHGVAQGIAACHYNIVVSDSASSYLSSLPRRIGEEPEAPDSSEKETDGPGDTGHQSGEKLNIAFRYERMSVASPDVPSDKSDFCAAYDLNRRINPSILRDAETRGYLFTLPPSPDGYDATIHSIDLTCREIIAKHPPAEGMPVIRISVRNLGGLVWGEATPSALVRFMLQLRRLVRDLCPPAAPAKAYAVAGVTLSSLASALVPSQLAHLSDAALSMSCFSASGPSLRTNLAGRYTGAVHVLRAPALGQLMDGSARASVLRGLGATSVVQTRSGTGTAAVGGAGWGGENNLAFSVRRRTFKVELLQVDEPGEEKPSKQAKQAQGTASTQQSPDSPGRNSDTATADASSFKRASRSSMSSTLPAASAPAPVSITTTPQSAPDAQTLQAPAPAPAADPAPAPTQIAAPAPAPAPKGLAFLRARGQRLRSSQPSVQLDGESAAPTSAVAPRSRPAPVQLARSAKDLEF